MPINLSTLALTMPYATRSDMLTAYGSAEMVQLTDLELPHTGAVVDAVLDLALVAASAEIDGYLIGRYTLPLAATPAILVGLCTAIAHYRLQTTAPDEAARKRYEDAVRYLEKVAEGKISILAPADVPPPAGAGAVLFSAGSKVFGREGSAASFGEAC